MTDKLLTIVSVTWGQAKNKLPLFLHSCALQDCQDFKVVIYHDGTSKDGDEATALSALMTERVCHDFAGQVDVEYKASETRFNDFGHSLRSESLTWVDTKYLNWNNCDNYLTPRFVGAFVSAMEGNNLDFCYSNILHNYANVNGDGRGPYNVLDSHPHLNRIDIANFVTKTEWAKKTGFNHRDSGADGLFVQELINWHGSKIKAAKIDIVPLVHN